MIVNYNIKNINENKMHNIYFKRVINFYKENINFILKNISFFFKKKILNYKNIYNNYIYYILYIILIFWFIKGFHIIKESEIGILLRFGKYNNVENPGLNWKIYGIDKIKIINIKKPKNIISSEKIITSDENIVFARLNVQYKIYNIKKYIFNFSNSKNVLKQIIDSSLVKVIGKYSIKEILKENKNFLKNDLYKMINNLIKDYNIGVNILDINLEKINLPKNVKDSFNEVISAKENEIQYIKDAKHYNNKEKFKAYSKYKKIIEDSKSYRIKALSKMNGEIKFFKEILSYYKKNPEITKKRLYLNFLEKSFKNVRKIIIDHKLINKLIILEKIDNIAIKKK